MTPNESIESPPADLPTLIRLAVSDAKLLDRNGYVADSRVWHTGSRPGFPCGVCFAGAVMAGTLGGDSRLRMSPQDASTAWRKALFALDDVRIRHWENLAASRWISSGEAENLAKRWPMYDSDELHFFTNWNDFDEFLECATKIADLVDRMRNA